MPVLVPDVERVWGPVQEEDEFIADVTTEADQAARGADVLIVVKPLPGSFDRGLELRKRLGIPLVLDVDDPDWERTYGEGAMAAAASFVREAVRGRPPVNAYRLRGRARHTKPLIVSNPGMHRWYGEAAIVPHARPVRPPGREHIYRPTLDVAFVGTVRPHKGTATLREAVRRVPNTSLTVTSPPPPDATEQERWVGYTPVRRGWQLVDESDVVAVVSSPTIYGRGQLPVKLIDAMLAGRAVIASDLPPLRWALADTGVIVPPDDAAAVGKALERLRSPELRTELGARARERAIAMFSVDVVGRSLAEVVRSALR
jgi:hypothetical protein